MNLLLALPEIAVVLCGVALLLIDLWLAPARRRAVCHAAVLVLGLVFAYLILAWPEGSETAFSGLFVQDPLSVLFKQIFLLCAMGVLLMASETQPRGTLEMHSLCLFVLSGMMFASSSGNFVLAFVSLELISVTFYILTGFRRDQLSSLEAGAKYLVLGAISTGFLVYGIALVYGATGSMSFEAIASAGNSPLLQLGLLFVLGGIGFKIAAFPWQIWVPDVYQGAPTPVAAFLAIGSKAAGFAVLLRVLGVAAPGTALDWQPLLALISMATILYGNLCALAQRDLKRLAGYSGIAHAGYLLMGIAAATPEGGEAIGLYLYVYLFSALPYFAILALLQSKGSDLSVLAGLGTRAPFLALALTLALASLAGIPPLAGFFGKFSLILAVAEQALSSPWILLLLLAAVSGVAISLAYYFNLVRIMFWPREIPDGSPVPASRSMRILLSLCIFGMCLPLALPGPLFEAARQAAGMLF